MERATLKRRIWWNVASAVCASIAAIYSLAGDAGTGMGWLQLAILVSIHGYVQR